MSEQPQDQVIDRLNFNGKEYKIADLTDKVKSGINALLKVQQNLNELAQQVRIQQSAQTEITRQVQQDIEEDKIKEVESAETKVADEQMEAAHEVIESEAK
jgi:NADPH:quinone reductase-like Zn-dependent oxidoreductase|tara:strand:+ start:313 stop:615 length:303 start_codon:yes stop_codon:yes gene_type:complete